MDDRCDPSLNSTHEWRAFLSGGYKCVYCGREWVPVEPCVDPDEIGGHPWEPEPDPLWPKVVGIVVALVFIAIVFGTVGVK